MQGADSAARRQTDVVYTFVNLISDQGNFREVCHLPDTSLLLMRIRAYSEHEPLFFVAGNRPTEI